MPSFISRTTPLSGVYILERMLRGDERGWLQRMYCANELSELGVSKSVAQSSLTFTRQKGAVRGMHFQYSPMAETKLVSCLQGKVFDVAVDLRAGSPTFLKWHAEVLSFEAANTLLIPAGFAHGFQTLTEDCQLLYFHTSAYSPPHEGGVNPQDPKLAIAWPLAITEISERDSAFCALTTDFQGVVL
ncbi:MAG: dTDP-4-dehydrorhamnose 3,5-epimerase [Rhodocyclales bacterium]|nr:dTDP-4-dehydrorhamnose 3,5-epimerase [Rhodocyclales bacterium]